MDLENLKSQFMGQFMDLPLIVESLDHRGLPKVCKNVLVICEAGPA